MKMHRGAEMVIEKTVGGGLSPDCGEALWKIGG